MADIKAVIGLGNPGREYAFTRHNLGCMVVDHLLEGARVKESRKRKNYTIDRATISRRRLYLVKTRVYVNNSGQALLSLLSKEKMRPESALVVCDDVDLPLGGLRLRRSGSSGGHRGLKSIIDCVGEAFPRLRLGVGGPDGDMVDHVLGKFSEEESGMIDDVLEASAEVVRGILRDGLEKAMSNYNRKEFWVTGGQ